MFEKHLTYCLFGMISLINFFQKDNIATSFDFDMDGKYAATVDRLGLFLVSEIDTDKGQLCMKIGSEDGN